MTVTRRNILSNYMSSGTNILISILVVPFYIKLLGVEAYGLIGFYTSLIIICNIFDLGLSPALNRELASYSVSSNNSQQMNDLLRTLELIYWPMALLIGLTIISLSPVLSTKWFNVSRINVADVQNAIYLMGLAIACQWPVSLYSGGLMGIQAQHILAVINVFAAAARGLGGVCVLWLYSPTIHALLMWHIVVNLLWTFFTAYQCRRCLPDSHLPPRFNKKLLPGISRFAGGMTSILIMAAAIGQADKLILSKQLSLEMFGYYSIACVISSGVLNLATPLYYALFPRFTQLISNKQPKELSGLYGHSCELFSVIVFPVVITISIFSKEILYLWTGQQAVVENTGHILSFLIISTAFNLLMNLPQAYQLAHGWTSLTVYCGLFTLGTIIPVVIYFSTNYGAIGAAFSMMGIYGCLFFVYLSMMNRRLKPISLMVWFRDVVFKPLAATFTIAVIGKIVLSKLSLSYPFLFFFIICVFSVSLAASAATSKQIKILIQNQRIRAGL